MQNMLATPATTEHFELAEGPVWDAARGRVLWVDILRGLVLEGRLGVDDVEVTTRHEFDGMVGAVVPATDGSLLVAGQEELVVLRPDGTRETRQRFVPPAAGRRANDGKVDPAGRFLIGTLALPGGGAVAGRETLQRVEPDGSLTVIDDDLGLSNGLAWSVDGRTLFSVDTRAGIVWRRGYDPVGRALGVREVHLEVTEGHPDGMCADVDGGLWIAIWGAGEVRRYAADGTVTAVVSTTAPHTSSVAFVGPDLDRLLITTGRQNLTTRQLERYPDSGLLFLATPGVRGIPSTPWRDAR